jgi:hypothetical protein
MFHPLRPHDSQKNSNKDFNLKVFKSQNGEQHNHGNFQNFIKVAQFGKNINRDTDLSTG